MTTSPLTKAKSFRKHLGEAATGLLVVLSPVAVFFIMDRLIRDVLSSVNITPTHLGAHRFAPRSKRHHEEPRLQRVYKHLADCGRMPSIPPRGVFT